MIDNRYRLIIIIVLIALIVAICAGLWYSVDNKENYTTELNNIYNKSFYEASDTLKDIETKLSKLMVTKSVTAQKELLFDISLDAETGGNNMAVLSTKNNDIGPILKYFNQLGDFTYYLAKNMGVAGIEKNDKTKLNALYQVTRSLRVYISSTEDLLVSGNKELFDKLTEGIALIGDSYENFNNDSSIDYPEMIYDGPFSDGISVRDAVYLKLMSEVKVDKAQEKVQSIFGEDAVVTYSGTNEGSIDCYIFDISIGGDTGMAEVSKKGGYVVSFNIISSNISSGSESDGILASLGLILAEKLGYNNLKKAWQSEYGELVYINYVYANDGVLYYPDMIKVKMTKDGRILGFDATSYIYNHTSRGPKGYVWDVKNCTKSVSPLLDIKGYQLVVIPTEWNTELLCYEFYGTYDDGEYYVYINADNGKEIKVMKVIDGNVA